MDVSYFYLILIFILGILLPIFSFKNGPKAKVLLTENPGKLISVYQQTVAMQVGLALLVFLALYFNNSSIDVIGLTFLKSPVAIASLLFLCFLFFWVLSLKTIAKSDMETLKLKYAEVIYIIPLTKKEFKWSVILSFIVGSLEEILYRGFLFWQLTLYMPIVAALIITNVIFGMLHFGTGIKNAISTFWLGMIYSALSIPFGTLWFAILAHIITDIYAVSIGYRVKKSTNQS